MCLDPDEALREVEAIRTIAEQSGAPTFIAVALLSRAHALALTGQRVAADECFAQAIEVARDNVIHVEITVMLTRGLLDVERDPDTALIALRDAINLAEHHGIMVDLVLNAYEGIAAIWLERGRLRDVAVLMAAVDRVREVVQVRGTRSEAPRRDRIHRILDEELAVDDREALTARGLAFTRDDLRRFVSD
jgi:tetratricopeptide (TPR) repeat protein